MGTVVLRRRVTVEGRVQGVFFRAECRRQAQSLGLAGWVRNHADGTVEAVFEGAAAQVEAMSTWMGHGPSMAVVEHVMVFVEEPEGLVGFEVREG